MDREKQVPSPSLVEEYRRQLMELYGTRSTPPVAPEENWLDSRFPEPDPERDRQAIPLVTEPDPEPEPMQEETSEPAPTPPESEYIGYLRVFVFTGEEAEPLVGARVVVSRFQGDDRTVYANLVTDRDGYTPVIPLPSVDPALSQRPGNPSPYTAYDIQVQAEGFQPVRYGSVPIYGNNYVTQPAAMLPLLPGADPEDTRQFSSGGPTNL